MSLPPPHPADPIRLHTALAAMFAVLCAVRLTTPSAPFFDEVHYLPAARTVLDLSSALNMEHPPLGKQAIALGMLVFGDNPLGWRIMPAAFGVLGLFAAMRAMWFAGQSRAASLLTGLFLITGFPLLVQARIAMLDIIMLGFVMLALWMCAAAMREPERARWRLAIAGIALGAAMAAKWNAVPLAMLPGLALLAVRLRHNGWRFLTATRSGPIAGMALWEAALWLGLVPLVVYSLSYWPFALFAQVNGDPASLLALHRQMLDMQTQVLAPHPYQSQWWQWAGNTRGIWYLYEVADGAQRGVVMMGNPLSSLAALPALAWCGWAAWKDRRSDCAMVLVLYAVSLGLWIVAPKPTQFYYHYLLPHCFSMAALALAVETLWQRGWRRAVWAVCLGSAGLLVFYYPILTAAALSDPQDFLRWAWLEGWR
jgi:dolichyl-phosphate-mannose-protein mannosyltransferase